MVMLEVCRHSMRSKPGDHLSQEGVSLARRVGEGMGPFDRVLTSFLPRAFETAIAMGFAVDTQMDWLTVPGSAVDQELPYPQSFAAYAAAYPVGWAVTAFCREQAECWWELASSLPDGGNVLMVTHGGVVEMGAVGALLPDVLDTDFTSWGGPIGYCEGVRLTFDGKRFTGGEVLRVPGSRIL